MRRKPEHPSDCVCVKCEDRTTIIKLRRQRDAARADLAIARKLCGEVLKYNPDHIWHCSWMTDPALLCDCGFIKLESELEAEAAKGDTK